jgi:hypothetical protein
MQQEPTTLLYVIEVIGIVIGTGLAVVSVIALIIYTFHKTEFKMALNDEKRKVIHNADMEILREEQNKKVLTAKAVINGRLLSSSSIIDAEPAEGYEWRQS